MAGSSYVMSNTKQSYTPIADDIEEDISTEPTEEVKALENAPDDNMTEMRELFKMFDRDNSGNIDPSELGDALRSIGGNPTDDTIKQMIEEADGLVNLNGKLEFEEFYEVITKYLKSPDVEEAEMKAAFRLFDKNGDGKVSKEELRKGLIDIQMKDLTEDELDNILNEADPDDSGIVDLDVLIKVIMKMY